MSRKLLTSLALVTALLGVAACSDDGATDPAEEPGEAEQVLPEEGQPELPDPDVADIPDVVASVNGEEISGEEFTNVYTSQFPQLAMQSQMTGEEIDQDAMKAQTLDSMVGNTLLIQDAGDRGHEASEAEVDELLNDAAVANGMESADDLIAAYEEQGLSEDDLRTDATNQVLIEKVVADLDVAEPTEAEVEALYEQYSEQPAPEGEEPPTLEEMRPELEEQLSSQKENEALMGHVEQLREGGDVELFL